MKQIFLFAAILIGLQANAKIWRVNNNPSYNADVQQPHTLFNNTNSVSDPEAAAGDTLHFEPSNTDYNGFTINKANIVVLGYGYFLDNNVGSQAIPNNAALSGVTINNNATGCKLLGVEISSTLYIHAANTLISRCYITGTTIFQSISTPTTGIRIDKCFIQGQFYSQSITASTTVTIENNIFSWNTNSSSYGLDLSSNLIKGIIRNNIFNQPGTIYSFNMYYANNIFIGQPNFGGVGIGGNNIFRNNLFSYPQSNTTINPLANPQVNNNSPNSNNQFAVNMTTVFTGIPMSNSGQAWNGTNYFHDRININAGATNIESRFDFVGGANPALNAGETGTTFGGAAVTTPNLGAFGATDPYRKGGFPPIPRITALTVPASVPNTNTSMTISVSSSSNN